jgi:hypothetical protein
MVSNVNANTAAVLYTSYKQTEGKSSNDSKPAATSAFDTLEISDAARAARNEGITKIQLIDLPGSERHIFTATMQLFREMRGRPQDDLKAEMSSLADAFENVRERFNSDPDGDIHVLERAFHNVASGSFVREELSNAHATLFANLFLANFKTLGVREAFDAAWAAVQAVISGEADIGDFSDDPDILQKQLQLELNSANQSKEIDKAAIIEGNRKLTAIQIAMRIARGDNVPMQDHKFLAEYDAKMYMAAMKASQIAKSDDRRNHESLVDEMLAAEDALMSSDDDNQRIGTGGDGSADVVVDG